MALRGRKPKPTASLALEGALRPKRHAERALVPQPPPAQLDEMGPPPECDPAVRERWFAAIEHAPAGILAVIDRDALYAYCVSAEQHHRAVRAQSALDAGKPMPFLTKGLHGPVVSPYMRIIRDTALVMARLAGELGFTPASRPRLVVNGAFAGKRLVNGQAIEDPWAGFPVPGDARGFS